MSARAARGSGSGSGSGASASAGASEATTGRGRAPRPGTLEALGLSRSKLRLLLAYEDALRRRGRSAATIASRRKTLSRFLRRFAGRHLAWLDRADVERYLAERAEVVAPAVQADEAQAVRAFLATLVDLGLLRRSPAAELRVRRASRPAPLLLSEAAVWRLLSAASAHPRWSWAALRDRAALELLYGAGLRGAEVRAALLVDLDFDAGTLLCRRAKRGEQRVVPLPRGRARAPPRLRRRGAPRPRPLRRRPRPRPPAPYAARSALRGLGPAWARHRRRPPRGPPRPRPRAAPRGRDARVRAGASVLAVQELLGHQRLDTTAVYVACDRDDLRRAVGVLERLHAP